MQVRAVISTGARPIGDADAVDNPVVWLFDNWRVLIAFAFHNFWLSDMIKTRDYIRDLEVSPSTWG